MTTSADGAFKIDADLPTTLDALWDIVDEACQALDHHVFEEADPNILPTVRQGLAALRELFRQDSQAGLYTNLAKREYEFTKFIRAHGDRPEDTAERRQIPLPLKRPYGGLRRPTPVEEINHAVSETAQYGGAFAAGFVAGRDGGAVASWADIPPEFDDLLEAAGPKAWRDGWRAGRRWREGIILPRELWGASTLRFNPEQPSPWRSYIHTAPRVDMKFPLEGFLRGQSAFRDGATIEEAPTDDLARAAWLRGWRRGRSLQETAQAFVDRFADAAARGVTTQGKVKEVAGGLANLRDLSRLIQKAEAFHFLIPMSPPSFQEQFMRIWSALEMFDYRMSGMAPEAPDLDKLFRNGVLVRAAHLPPEERELDALRADWAMCRTAFEDLGLGVRIPAEIL